MLYPTHTQKQRKSRDDVPAKCEQILCLNRVWTTQVSSLVRPKISLSSLTHFILEKRNCLWKQCFIVFMHTLLDFLLHVWRGSPRNQVIRLSWKRAMVGRLNVGYHNPSLVVFFFFGLIYLANLMACLQRTNEPNPWINIYKRGQLIMQSPHKLQLFFVWQKINLLFFLNLFFQPIFGQIFQRFSQNLIADVWCLLMSPSDSQSNVNKPHPHNLGEC